jgi:hypothetical protein
MRGALGRLRIRPRERFGSRIDERQVLPQRPERGCVERDRLVVASHRAAF